MSTLFQRASLLFLFLTFAASAQLLESPAVKSQLVYNEKPYWKTKEHLYNRILNQREIIVSVKVRKDSARQGFKRLLLIGGGVIQADYEEVFIESKKLDNLVKMSSYVKRSEMRPNNKFFLHTKAFGYHAKMLMDVEYKLNNEFGEIHWQIIKGTFQGMKGIIRFNAIGMSKSEIGLHAEYSYQKLPIPQFFIEFGLEVAMQKMAGAMRKYFEQKLKAGGN